MDLATLIGMVAAIGIILSAIVLGGSPMAFVDVPSMLIVVGGSAGAVLIKFTLSQFLASFKVAIKAFIFKLESPEALIKEAVEMATEVRKSGLLALESKVTNNTFLAKGIELMVDGHDAEIVRRTLVTDMNLAVERHDVGVSIFKSIGDAAPAMGMIGTLVGLVQMLGNMSDPKSIG
ncbi:MAG: MotA/TolQ/ExbB proton channel family protein, partial [Gammaproteobacteria bacterium]|nr:MotA/TolQ/ExbB proton channel family protein [Gammaproteobacteria bacterium]